LADPSLAQACQHLGAGERGAILLAKSLPADLILLDEWKARRIALADDGHRLERGGHGRN
jgi:predicted nucleic acid-binding protein